MHQFILKLNYVNLNCTYFFYQQKHISAIHNLCYYYKYKLHNIHFSHLNL